MMSPHDSIVTASQTIPARAGIGLRSPHHEQIIRTQPNIGWLEVHSENYFADGGTQLDKLMQARALYPLSLHGVGLSLGSTDPLNIDHLRKLKRLIARSEPHFVSEHLAWGSINSVYANDLLPLPYTSEALTHMTQRIAAAQDYLGRKILIENVSSYLQFSGEQCSEWEFLGELSRATGCGLLVDINNIYVSAHNHGFNARRYIAALPAQSIGELHLAGHTQSCCGERDILIDTHSAPVCAGVWELYEFALQCYGAIPTLIEWDADIPALEVLLNEATRADRLLEKTHELAA